MSNAPYIAIGTVWAERQADYERRTVRIVSVTDQGAKGRVTIETLTNVDGSIVEKSRRTTCAVPSFRSRFRPVEVPPDADVEAVRAVLEEMRDEDALTAFERLVARLKPLA